MKKVKFSFINLDFIKYLKASLLLFSLISNSPKLNKHSIYCLLTSLIYISSLNSFSEIK